MTKFTLSRRDLIGAYQFEDEGRTFFVVRGWALAGAARRRALMGRWYVTDETFSVRLGNADGYLKLRDVREHGAAVLQDRANGHEAHWCLPKHSTKTEG